MTANYIPASFSKLLLSKSLTANFFKVFHLKITMYTVGGIKYRILWTKNRKHFQLYLMQNYMFIDHLYQLGTVRHPHAKVMAIKHV